MERKRLSLAITLTLIALTLAALTGGAVRSQRRSSNRRQQTTQKNEKAGSVISNKLGMEFVYVPAGTFMMGSTEAEIQAAYEDTKRRRSDAVMDWFLHEKPRHRVTIRKGFYMGRYEVTQAQWQKVMGNNPSKFKGCDDCPVDHISWNNAQEFIGKLNATNDGYVYRLPTEAEWEYACRAGTTTAFAFGDSLSSEQANFNGNYPFGSAAKGVNRQKTTPVGSFQPNAWGLYDMHGNVWEWCEDVWSENYQGAPGDGSAWLNGYDSTYRVLRGGSWYNYAYLSRSAYRINGSRYDGDDLLGFRIVATTRDS